MTNTQKEGIRIDIVRLAPPWITFYKEVVALFGEDPDIRIVYDGENYHIKLFVNNAKKADALQKLLPVEKTFGKVVVKLSVIPANTLGEDRPQLFEAAFENNPVFRSVHQTDPFRTGFPFIYVLFANKVVQFENDNMADFHGNMSTLYQNIATDVLGNHGVYYCTDLPEAAEKA